MGSSLTLGICPVEGFYLPDPSELTFANTLLLSNAAVSLGGAFVSLEISLQFLIFFSLFSFILAWTFVLAICGFLFLHLFYLHFLSSNNPLRNSTNNKIPFFPFIFLKDF